MHIKRGDTAPALTLVCELDGQPADLSGATVRVIGKQGGGHTIDTTVSGNAQGEVVYQWLPADTETVGTYQFEVEVTWPDERVQTFPAHRQAVVYVVSDLA